MRILALLLCLPLVVGCAPAAPIVTGPVRPAMWTISDGDTAITVIGSVHQLPPALDWVHTTAIETAVRRSDELWLEATPDDLSSVPARFAGMARDEPVASLNSRLGYAGAERVRDFAGDAGLDPQDADAHESWALALIIGNVLAADAGLSSANGVETRLSERFRDQGKPVLGLERAQDQLDLFNALPHPVQDSLLRRTIAGAPGAAARTRALIQAWARGDTERLEALSAADLAATPALAERLVKARNRAWAARLDTRMARPGRIFVAVGVGHLIGPDSLPDLLADRGYTVRRLQ